jgi:bifunctional non-homologous end joining protein LigD
VNVSIRKKHPTACQGPTKLIHHADRDVQNVVGGSLERQLALVNLGCIPVDVWQSRAAHERQPDWIVFDLAPGCGEFAEAARAGIIVKAALDDLGLVSFPKTSASRGLHVLVPLPVGPEFDEMLAFAEKPCRRLAAAHPRELTAESRIEDRQSRVYLDALRNAFGATVAAPYSVRRPGAPFSMPLRWSEVRPSLVPANFNIGNYKERLAGRDAWEDFFRSRQSIKPAVKHLGKI